MSVIPVLGRWRQEDYKFHASLGYIEGSRSVLATQQDPVSKKIKGKRYRVEENICKSLFDKGTVSRENNFYNSTTRDK
jgi:hypothetical protein